MGSIREAIFTHHRNPQVRIPGRGVTVRQQQRRGGMKERFFESQYLGKDLLLGKILRVTQRALTQNPIRCMDNSALFLKHSCITGCSEVCACC